MLSTIEAILLRNIIELFPSIPVYGENLLFDSDNSDFPADVDHYVRLTFVSGKPEMVTLGLDGLTNFTGFVQVDVYEAVGEGNPYARSYRDMLAAAFSPKRPILDDTSGLTIKFSPVSREPGGENDVTTGGSVQGMVDSSKWVTPITIPFSCDVNE